MILTTTIVLLPFIYYSGLRRGSENPTNWKTGDESMHSDSISSRTHSSLASGVNGLQGIENDAEKPISKSSTSKLTQQEMQLRVNIANSYLIDNHNRISLAMCKVF